MFITGTNAGGYGNYVDESGRQLSRSVSSTEVEEASLIGDSYNINTGRITGIAGDSALLYFKNNETRDFIIDLFAVGIGDGLTITDMQDIFIVRSPTGFSTSTAVDMNGNLNVGSNRTLDATVYKGANGATLTGGTNLGVFFHQENSRLAVSNLKLIVPNGGSLGIKVELNASGGSCEMYAAISGHLRTNAQGANGNTDIR